MNRQATKLLKFARRNRNKLIVGAVVTTVIIAQHSAIQRMNEFLIDKALFEEYYDIPSSE